MNGIVRSFVDTDLYNKVLPPALRIEGLEQE
jgi:hypothetical protein